MKSPLRIAAVFCWIFVNVGALIGISSNYSVAAKTDTRMPSVQTITQVAHSKTQDQLIKLFIEQDAALRGEIASFYAILSFWLEVTVLNIGLVVGYFWLCREAKR
jgi:hypothetical protein